MMQSDTDKDHNTELSTPAEPWFKGTQDILQLKKQPNVEDFRQLHAAFSMAVECLEMYANSPQARREYSTGLPGEMARATLSGISKGSFRV